MSSILHGLSNNYHAYATIQIVTLNVHTKYENICTIITKVDLCSFANIKAEIHLITQTSEGRCP